MLKHYLIRSVSGTVSDPQTADEIINGILRGRITAFDEISKHPGDSFVPIRTIPEFENAFAEVFEQQNQVTSDEEKTLVTNPTQRKRDPDHEITAVDTPELDKDEDVSVVAENKSGVTQTRFSIAGQDAEGDLFPTEAPARPPPVDPAIHRQKTQQIERPPELIRDKALEPKRKFNIPKKSALVMIMLALLLVDYMDEEEDEENATNSSVVTLRPVRPQLPSGGVEQINPEASAKIYNASIPLYMEDTVQGYRKAVQGLQLSLRADPQNTKAQALLASTYINLIDSSNKDEKTYVVINKLIELSRGKNLNLVESLIAEVEYLALSKRYDAGIQRLLDFYKVAGKIDPILYYYLGWLYWQKGEVANASKYLNQIPASALPMPKLYFLRGLIHEKNKELEEAGAEYGRALKLNRHHAKSLLGLVRISDQKGELKTVSRIIEFLAAQPSLQNPDEFVETLKHQAKLALLFQKPAIAVQAYESALKIQPRNENLRLEYYSLLAAATEQPEYRELAKMYALVLEGDRLAKDQKIHEAVTVFLQAKDAYPRSTVPIEKMGDLFMQQRQYQKAVQNYRRAVDLKPKSGQLAMRLIDALIQNHEYEDAQKWLAKYRSHPTIKSSIDRLAGDLTFYQGDYDQAVVFYRKAMARDTIDPEVYSSYAECLRQMDLCQDAQFFYSLAQRLDPLNDRALLGSAKCLLKTDGIASAVARIQDELSRQLKARPEGLVGIAELYLMEGRLPEALQFVAQAKEIDSEYPDTYKVESEIYLREIHVKKDLKKKMLEAMKAYSDRKVSDPWGYAQRFEILLADAQFEEANQELNRIFEISPRFPELHFRRARLLARMGRTREAIEEFEEELRLSPRMVTAMIELGNLQVQLNRPDDAMKNYLQAMAVDPTSAKAKIGAGYVNFLKRQFGPAIALYQAALALDRGNPEVYKRLGHAYLESGDKQSAAKAFQSYLDVAPDAPDRKQYEMYR